MVAKSGLPIRSLDRISKILQDIKLFCDFTCTNKLVVVFNFSFFKCHRVIETKKKRSMNAFLF